VFSLVTVAELKPLANVLLALLSGLLLAYFAGHRWSSWNETIAAFAFTMGICFLAALSLGGAIQGPGTLPAVGVLPFFCEYLGPRTACAGLLSSTWSTTSQIPTPPQQVRIALPQGQAQKIHLTCEDQTPHVTETSGMIGLTISMYPGPRGNRHRPLNLTLIRPELTAAHLCAGGTESG
jgi:hypothetical protein